MTDSVTIAIDTGASGIKVVAAIEGEHCVAFIMAPHCLPIDLDATEKADKFDEHRVWIKFDDKAYAVGTLAQTLGASVRMKPLKYAMATPRICAAIGVVIQKLELQNKFNLNIVCVLPASEFNDRDLVVEGVRSAIKTLQFPSGKAKINLKKMNVYPEGYGLLKGHGKELGEIESATTIMMGHRNVSCFTTKFGTPFKPSTSNYGFNYLLNDVASQTGYGTDDLLKLISACPYESLLNTYLAEKKDLEDMFKYVKTEYKYDKDTLEIYIKSYTEQIKNVDTLIEKEQNIKTSMDKLYQQRYYKIIKSEDKDREYEHIKLIKAIEKAKQSYVLKLTEWLDEHMPNQTNIVCIGGGVSKKLWDDIYPFLLQKVSSEQNPKSCILRDTSITYPLNIYGKMMQNDNRFADIYSLFML